MCDGCPLASPLFRRLAGRGVSFFWFLLRWVLRLAAFVTRGFPAAWIIILSHGKILLMIVVARAILYLAFSSLLCGFVATQLYWCMRLRQ